MSGSQNLFNFKGQDMKQEESQWRWQEGAVDTQQIYIELRYGDAETSNYADWQPTARIGEPKQNIFIIEWLITSDTPEHQSMITKTRSELDFYLVEKGESDPWAYALYHCNTASNMYSRVHWAYFPHGQGGVRETSELITLSAEEAEEVFGKSEERSIRVIKSKM